MAARRYQVAMCSKAGADFGASLFWCVIVAAAVAWVMQEGTGRLTLVAGQTLGEAVRTLTPSGLPLLGRHLLAAFALVGNFAYECNNFAGTMAAIDILLHPPGRDGATNATLVNCSAPTDAHLAGTAVANGTALEPAATSVGELSDGALFARQLINLALAPLTFGLLVSGTTDRWAAHGFPSKTVVVLGVGTQHARCKFLHATLHASLHASASPACLPPTKPVRRRTENAPSAQCVRCMRAVCATPCAPHVRHTCATRAPHMRCVCVLRVRTESRCCSRRS